MEARATLRRGQKGTKKLVTRFGDRLICVRYRYDTTRRKRFTTVELIVDEADWIASIPIAAEGVPPVPTESPTERPYRRRLVYRRRKLPSGLFWACF